MVLGELGSKITQALRRLNNQLTVDDAAVNAVLQDIARALIQADVRIQQVKELQDNCRRQLTLDELPAGVNVRKLVSQTVTNELIRIIDPGRHPYRMRRGESNVIMFVGLQGSGKTTTCAKYASYLKKKGWRCCLVCADTFRAGAFAQLRQNAERIGIPYTGSTTETNPVAIAQQGVEMFRSKGYEVIIVDTSGRHTQDTELFEEMEQVYRAVHADEVIFVMDGSIGQAAYNQASGFKQKVDVGSVIITKMDGHAKGGGALSAVAATGSPITFLGTGEMFDDFETFNPRSFVTRLLGGGDLKALAEAVDQIKVQPAMVSRMAKGIFTFRDLRDQFENVLKMGSLGKVMSMLPGFSQDILPKGSEKEEVARVRGFMCIMDSMTQAELGSSKPLAASRIARIARGSGHSVREVNDLMTGFKRFAQTIGNIGGMIPKGGDLNAMKGMNPSQMANLAKGIHPGILQKMGGMGGLQSMMRQFGNMKGGGPGGMPDMSQFGGMFG